MSDWLRQADAFIRLAEEASSTGDHVVMIAALQRAAECVQMARLGDASVPQSKKEAI